MKRIYAYGIKSDRYLSNILNENYKNNDNIVFTHKKNEKKIRTNVVVICIGNIVIPCERRILCSSTFDRLANAPTKSRNMLENWLRDMNYQIRESERCAWVRVCVRVCLFVVTNRERYALKHSTEHREHFNALESHFYFCSRNTWNLHRMHRSIIDLPLQANERHKLRNHPNTIKFHDFILLMILIGIFSFLNCAKECNR